MKCYVCSYSADKFGKINISSSDGYGAAIGRMPKNSVGSVDIHVCPQCGALHSDMRGSISDPNRK
jgi:hypothetical protein